MTHTTPAHRVQSRSGTAPQPVNPTIVAVGGLALGLLLLIVAFANLNRMPDWADDYGAVVVYLAFFLYMSIAGRLTWWGIDALREQVKTRREQR
ncbi:hypothetical protein AB0N05_27045 [Nocardia sp. NPDC051030]|uniref:hypothetical protein n=1 Tax=Nocardia sp. NPDC051030 TaxID=3155162 RepID=UPI00342839B6